MQLYKKRNERQPYRKAPYGEGIDKNEYLRRYYQEHKPKFAARKAYRQKHDLEYRLRAVLRTIQHRCDSPKFIGYRYYGGKGIRNFLTFNQLLYLWKRDKAWRFKRPSIDRIDNNSHYKLPNVRFIELGENVRRAIKARKPAEPSSSI